MVHIVIPMLAVTCPHVCKGQGLELSAWVPMFFPLKDFDGGASLRSLVDSAMAKRSGDDGDDGAAALGSKKLKMESDQDDPNPDPQQN